MWEKWMANTLMWKTSWLDKEMSMLFRVARESASISLVEKAFDCICGLICDWEKKDTCHFVGFKWRLFLELFLSLWISSNPSLIFCCGCMHLPCRLLPWVYTFLSFFCLFCKIHAGFVVSSDKKMIQVLECNYFGKRCHNLWCRWCTIGVFSVMHWYVAITLVLPEGSSC